SGHVGDGVNNPLTLNKLCVNLELDKAVESLETEVINSNFKSAEFAGDVSIARDGVSFKGSVDLKAVKLVSGFNVEGLGSSPLSIKHFRIAGEFTPAEGHSFAASAAMDLQNASTFDVFAWADYSGRSESLYSTLDIELATVEALAGMSLNEMSRYEFAGYPAGGGYHYFVEYSLGEESSQFNAPATNAQRQIVEELVHSALAEEFAGNIQFVNKLDIEV